MFAARLFAGDPNSKKNTEDKSPLVKRNYSD